MKEYDFDLHVGQDYGLTLSKAVSPMMGTPPS